MTRREFITLLGGAAVAWQRTARAQQGERMRHVGVLMNGTATDATLMAFVHGLRQLGWTEGQNLRTDRIMRTIVLVSIALAAMSLTSTYADAGAWCASYRRGVSNCSYSSIDQCLATVRGLGGFCRPNPFPGTAYGTSSGSWNVPDSPRRYRRGY
jgi:Protein of unknown function (DUF3551)